MHRRVFIIGGLLLVALPAAYACGTNLPPSTDDVAEAGADDAGDASSAIDDEPPPADSGALADVVGIDASFTPCAEKNLVARWKLDETSGDVVADCSGTNNHGVRLGGQVVAGAPDVPEAGSALAFAGGEWVGFGNPANLNITGALTVSAWIKPGSMTDTRYIVGKSTDYTANGWRLAYRSEKDRNISFGLAVPVGTSTDGCFAIGGSVAEGDWVHVAGVFRPGESVELYLDGVLVATTDNCKGSSIVPSASEVRIGARADGAATFVGVIDDVRVYDAALAKAAIEALVK